MIWLETDFSGTRLPEVVDLSVCHHPGLEMSYILGL